MLRLKKIRRENNVISAEYEPEDSNESGFVAIDIDTGKIIKWKLTSLEDEDFPMYNAHARWALRDMRNLVTLPKSQLVMWC
jgi:hypothetical protein